MLLRLQSNSTYDDIAGKLLWNMVIPALTREWSCFICLSLLFLWILSGTATTTPALLKGLFSLWIQQDNYCIAMSAYFYLGIQHGYCILMVLSIGVKALPTPFSNRPCLRENILLSCECCLDSDAWGHCGRKTHAKTPRLE